MEAIIMGIGLKVQNVVLGYFNLMMVRNMKDDGLETKKME